MDLTLVTILCATLLVSLISLAGIFTISLKASWMNRLVIYLVALAAGAMLGSAFFHLLPESFEYLDPKTSFLILISAFVFFLLMEKLLHWRHCHHDDCDVHTIKSFGYMNLLGDIAHNFIDGLIIAGAFVVSFELGVATTVAVAIHEIPQEIGDFGVLVHAGFSRKKALLLNFATALTAMLGALVGYWFATSAGEINGYILPFAAGGFLYIAASDLLPEMRKEKDPKKLFLSFAVFVIGLALMFVLSGDGHSEQPKEDEFLDRLAISEQLPASGEPSTQ